MKYLFVFVTFFIGFTPITAANDLGTAIGAPIPHMLELSDQQGTSRNFKGLTGEKGLVIAFVRSADWCPYCKKQLIDLQSEAYAEITARGFKLVGISYDPVQKLATFAETKGIHYPLLSDEGSAAIKAFGILNEKYSPGDRVYGIPHPVVFITDAEGVIKAKLYEEGYKTRPQTDAILAALDEIR